MTEPSPEWKAARERVWSDAQWMMSELDRMWVLVLVHPDDLDVVRSIHGEDPVDATVCIMSHPDVRPDHVETFTVSGWGCCPIEDTLFYPYWRGQAALALKWNKYKDSRRT